MMSRLLEVVYFVYFIGVHVSRKLVVKCKWRENFIAPSESPVKVRKIAVYRFLVSFLVPELLRFKDLKNCQKLVRKNARSRIKSIKINKICDVM